MQDLSILIKALLDQKSEESIKRQIDALQAYCDSKNLHLKLDIDNTQFRQFADNISKITSTMNQVLGETTDKFVEIKNNVGETTKKITESTNAQKQQVQVTENLNKETQEFEVSQTKITSNYKQQRQEQEKLAKQQQQEQKAVKNVSDTITNQIRLLQTRVALLKQNSWTADFSGVDNFAQKLDVKNIDPANYKTQIADLKNQYQLIANTVQESHRNNLDALQKEVKLEEVAAQKKLQLETQKNASAMQNWAKQLDVDAQIRKGESDRIKMQMQENTQLDQQTVEIKKQLDLYKQQLAIKNQNLQTSFGKSYDANGMNNIINQANSLNASDFSSVQQLKDTTKQLDLQVDKVSANMKKMRKEATLAMKESDTFMKTLVKDFGKMIAWSVVGTALFGTIKLMKQAVSSMQEIEDQMISIARVMEDVYFKMNTYAKSLFDISNATGSTFKQSADVALRFAQAGYNVSDSLQLTQVALQAVQTAELDATNATESMIGIMSQWNMSAAEMTLLLDKINITSDEYTVTSQDLVDGLLRSSSAARNLGLSLDETISLLTVLRETSGRTGKEVGNALSSILSYLVRGKSIDTLLSSGIEVFTDDTQSQFRNVVDIFKDIGAKWDTLSKDVQNGFIQSADEAGLYNEELANTLGLEQEWSDVQKRDVSNATAGVYRRNYFIGLINSIEKTNDVMNTLNNAQGYTAKEMERNMDKLSVKVTQFGNAFNEMAKNIGEKGGLSIVKTIVDAGTALIKLLDSGFGRFVATTTLLTAGVYGLGVAFTVLSKSTLGTALGVAAIDLAEKGLIVTSKALWVTLSASPLFWIAGAVLGFQGLVAIINAADNAAKKQAEKIRKLKEEYDSLSASLEDNETKYQNVIDRMNELYQLRLTNKITPAEEEELERLKLVSDELERQVKYQKALKADQAVTLENESLELSGTKTEQIANTKTFKLTDVTVDEKAGYLSQIVEDYTNKIDDLSTAYDEGKITAQEYKKELDDLINQRSFYVTELDKMIQKLQEEKQNYQGFTAEGDARKAVIEGLIEGFQNLVISLNDTNAAIKDTDDGTSNTISTFVDLTDSIKDSAKAVDDYNKAVDTMQSNISDINDVIEKMNKGTALTSSEVIDLVQKYPSLINSLTQTKNGYTVNVDALETLRTAQVEEMKIAQQSAIDKKVAVLNSISAIVKGYGIQIEAIKSVAQAEAQLAGSKLNMQGLDTSQFDLDAGTYKGKSLSEYWGLSEAGVKTLTMKANIAKTTLEIGKLYDQANALDKLISSPSFFKGFGGSSGSKSAQEIYKPIIDAYFAIQNELDNIAKKLEENQTLTEQAEGSDKIALLQKRLDLYKQQEDALKRLNAQQKNELALLQKTLSGKGFKFDAEGNITNYAENLKRFTGETAKQIEDVLDRFVELGTTAIPDVNNQILQLGKSIKDIGKETETYLTDTFQQYYDFLFNSIEKEISEIENAKKAAQKASQDKIDGYEAEIKELEKKNDKQKEEEERTKRLMDLAKQGEKLANIQANRDTKLYNADGSVSLVANPKSVREETENLQNMESDYYKWEEDIRNENAIQKIRDDIEAEQTALETALERYDNQIEGLQKFIQEQKDILSGANNFQITNTEQLAKALEGIDSELYAGRLEALNNFVNAFNSTMGTLNIGNAPLPSISLPKTAATTITAPKTSSPTTSAPATSAPTTTTPKSSYTGNSIVDYLKTIGVDASFENRRALSGLGSAYKGTATQNAELLKKLRGFDTGTINTSPGLAMLHGTKSQPEAIFNTKQINNLFRLLDSSFSLKSFQTPSLAGVGASSGGTSNVYHVSVGSVQTNDANDLIKNLRNLTNKK
jgi:hypothetical protein